MDEGTEAQSWSVVVFRNASCMFSPSLKHLLVCPILPQPTRTTMEISVYTFSIVPSVHSNLFTPLFYTTVFTLGPTLLNKFNSNQNLEEFNPELDPAPSIGR